MGATAAVAVIVRKERELVDHLRSVGAVSPDTARTLSQLGADQGPAWRRLVEHAVIRSTPVGTWYLDEPSWMALRRMRRRLALVVAAAGLIVALGAMIVSLIGGHR
ncbi:MAG TPA: hypothetical protein VGR60_04975 [Gemmatimonadales bacterium]|nr:hypothetical protein [Gemmatimonadales bacterium]